MISILRSKGMAENDDERRPPRLTLLREVKVDSPIHRLSTETKFVSVAGLSVTISFFPTWGTIGLIIGLLVLATVVAHVPKGALPRPPIWFGAVIIISGGFASVAGGSPYLSVGGLRLGLGAADGFCKFVLVGMTLVFAAMVIGWTTSLGEVAPAMRRLFGPLRWIKVPVEEWAVAVALCIRSFPLMLTEMRALIAARRLRPLPDPGEDETVVDTVVREIVDIIVAVLAVAVRRSGELADAITARGGTGLIAAGDRRLRISDLIALIVVGAVCFAASQMPVP